MEKDTQLTIQERIVLEHSGIRRSLRKKKPIKNSPISRKDQLNFTPKFWSKGIRNKFYDPTNEDEIPEFPYRF